MACGWIKLHRQLLDDPVWTTATADQKASLSSLAKRAGVSVQSVRSAIARFEKLDFLTNESTKTGRLISVMKWATYQEREDAPNKEASKDPTKTQQLSRSKECKKDIPYVEIVSILNEATGKKYRAGTSTTQSLIKVRWNEGFRLEDFRAVIHGRVATWGNNPEMAEYLRPQTLFGPKFEAYLNSAQPSKGKTPEFSGDIQHQQAAAEIARINGLA